MSSRRDLVGALEALIRVIELADSAEAVRNGVVMGHARDVAERAARGLITEVPWTPFVERTNHPVTDIQIQTFMRQHNLSEAEVRSAIAKDAASLSYTNSRYQVLVRDLPNGEVYLSIKRIDQQSIHDWRDLQRIKNELVGPECEFVELYPAESRCVDAANQYHLWGVRDPSYRFPIGFAAGGTLNQTEADAVGAGQRGAR